MDFAAQFSRQYRRPYERSISERRFEDHRFPSEFKGQLDLRKENSNSYHQGKFLLIIALSLISLARLTHASLPLRQIHHTSQQWCWISRMICELLCSKNQKPMERRLKLKKRRFHRRREGLCSALKLLSTLMHRLFLDISAFSAKWTF